MRGKCSCLEPQRLSTWPWKDIDTVCSHLKVPSTAGMSVCHLAIKRAQSVPCQFICCCYHQLQLSPRPENPMQALLPVRKMKRPVRESLLHLPPCAPHSSSPPSGPELHPVHVDPSQVVNPAEKAPSCLGRKPSISSSQERPRIVAQLEGIHVRSLLCRSS